MASIDLVFPGFPGRLEAWPEKGRRGTLGICTVALVRSDKTILFDTGHYGTRRDLIDGLKRHRVRPDEIDFVVLSHLHWDHALNVDLFSRPTVIVHKKELNYAKAPAVSDLTTPTYVTDLLVDKKIEAIDREIEIAKGVRVLETPGHTIGSIALAVRTGDFTSVLTGDAVANARSFVRGKPDLIFWKESEARRSVRKIAKIGNILYPGHDRPFNIEGKTISYLRHIGILMRMFPEPTERDFVLRVSTEDSVR